MRYNQFGRTGLVVSRLAFGAMNFGDFDFNGFKANVDEKLARELVARALDGGVNVFDTADMYSAGQSERILGKVLGARRKDVVLATKCFFRSAPDVLHAGLSRRHVIAAAEASLERLGTDYIDLLLLHNVDPRTPHEETARALDDLQRSGKVRYVGISNFAAWQAERLIGTQRRLRFDAICAHQVYYSLLGRDIEHAVVPQAEQAGLGMMVWGPLAGGFLSGKYTREQPDGGGARRATFDFPPVDRDIGYDVVDKLNEIAATRDARPAQIAIAWALSRPWVHTLLMGQTKMSQLESNLAAAALELSSDEIAALDTLTATPPPYPHWMHWGDQVTEAAIAEGFTPTVYKPN
ncbi:MAG: aldo/keto reductase [Myxococcales bacterium]|nr:aldo/keto reductase [Myxococcales bacterium]